MRRDTGIAPLVGVAIAAALTVTFSAGAAIVLVDDDTPEQPQAVGFRLATDLDSLELELVKGDEVPLHGGHLWVTVDGEETHLELTAFSDRLGDHWNEGERVCLTGYQPGCDEVPNGEVTQIRVASADQALWTWRGTWAAEPTGHVAASATSSGGGGSGGLGGGSGGAGSGSSDAGGPADQGGSGAPGSPDVDLLASLASSSPSEPHAGETVSFTGTVQNTGSEAPASSFTVSFLVDAELVSSYTLSPLEGGEATTVTSTSWQAEEGGHTVTMLVDGEDNVPESDEGNNGDALVLEVAPAGTPDPGHAYEDVDNDLRFTNGLDIPIPDDEVLDGSYAVETASHGLVLPASLGNISAETIAFESGPGGHLHMATNMTATNGSLELAGGTWLNATGSQLISDAGEIEIGSQGKLDASETTVTADRTLHVEAEGDIHLADATLEADIAHEPPEDDRKVTICHLPPGNPDNAQTITISEHAVKTHEDHHGDYQGPCIQDEGVLIDAGTDTSTVHVDGVTISDPDDTAIVVPPGAAISGAPAQGSVEHHDPEPIDP